MKITKFRGEYAFLSNFYKAPLKWEGLVYQSSESAFQSAKTVDKEVRKQFCNLDPVTSKRLGRQITLRAEWSEIEYAIMYDIVKNKFTQNHYLREKLLNTGDTPIEEGNTWVDTKWGICNGSGRNMLGRILMKVREELRR